VDTAALSQQSQPVLSRRSGSQFACSCSRRLASLKMEEFLQHTANQTGSSEAPRQGKSSDSVPNFPGRKLSIGARAIEVTDCRN